jgi:hypothetical protein
MEAVQAIGVLMCIFELGFELAVALCGSWLAKLLMQEANMPA